MKSVELIPVARKVVTQLLAVQPKERVLVIADSESDQAMVTALGGVLKDVGAEHCITYIPVHPQRGNDLPAFVEAGLEQVDVVIGVTAATGAGCYGQRIAELKNAGKLRLMSMVLRDYHDWTGGAAAADYEKVKALGDRLGEIWSQKKEVRVTTPAGTDFYARIEGERMVPNLGFATRPGESAAFPDGEQSQMPNEGTAEGILVVDGPLYRFGIPEEPVRFEIEKGRVVAVHGRGKVADTVRAILDKYENAANIAELGIGVNDTAELNGRFEEEKKALGTAHVALGDNVGYGGTVSCPVHMDMVIYKPTIIMDSEEIMVDGQLKI